MGKFIYELSIQFQPERCIISTKADSTDFFIWTTKEIGKTKIVFIFQFE